MTDMMWFPRGTDTSLQPRCSSSVHFLGEPYFRDSGGMIWVYIERSFPVLNSLGFSQCGWPEDGVLGEVCALYSAVGVLLQKTSVPINAPVFEQELIIFSEKSCRSWLTL